MVVPVDALLREENNIYEITCASIRRAYQLTITGEEDPEQGQSKVVSLAIRQILTRKVQYRVTE